MELDEIAYHQADGVVEIVLDRPEKLNAITARAGGTRDQILEVLTGAEADDSVGAVLLRGEGRAFSVGGDLTGNHRARPRPIIGRSWSGPRSCTNASATRGSRSWPRSTGSASAPPSPSSPRATSSSPRRTPRSASRRDASASSAHRPLVPIMGRQWAKFMILTGEPVGAELAARARPRAQRRGRRRARRPAARPGAAPRPTAPRGGRPQQARRRRDRRRRRATPPVVTPGWPRDAVTRSAASARASAPDGRTFRRDPRRRGHRGAQARPRRRSTRSRGSVRDRDGRAEGR